MTSISLIEASDQLQAGKVIAVPTDTVYGLAAVLHHSSAIRHLFDIKQRSHDKPLIILCAHFSQIASMVSFIPPSFDLLTQSFWPGALTIVLPIHASAIPHTVRAGLLTTGFRVPNHPLLLQLLEQFGPIVVTSANLSGSPAATCAKQVENDWGRDFPILHGDHFVKGVESTVISYCDNSWKILRPGAISAHELGVYVNVS